MSVGKLHMGEMLKEILDEADACTAAHNRIHKEAALDLPRTNSPEFSRSDDGVFKVPKLTLKKHPFRKFIEQSATNESPTSSIYQFEKAGLFGRDKALTDVSDEIFADSTDSISDSLSEKAAADAVEHLVPGSRKRKASGDWSEVEEFSDCEEVLPEYRMLEAMSKRGKHFGVCGPWSMAAGKDESWRDLL